MLDLPTVVLYGNIIFSAIYLIPSFINLKYYLELKLVDNLLISMHFMFWSIAVFFTGLSFVGIIDNFLFANFLVMIQLSLLYAFAVRTKWQKPPLYIYPVIIIYVFGFIKSLLTDLFRIQENINQGLLFPGIIELTYGFVIYAILTSDNPVSVTRITRTKFLWVMGAGLHLLGNGLFLITDAGGLGLIQFTETLAIYLILGPQYLGVVFFAILHIFYPEAVMITTEQLYRARNLYKRVEKGDSTKSDIDISQNALSKYLSRIPKDIMVEIEEKHSSLSE